MPDQRQGNINSPDPSGSNSSRTHLPSRRAVLAAAAAAGAPTASLLLSPSGSRPAHAQVIATRDADAAELARLLAARRILIKGAVVLSQDRGVGDFASADILIEDGRICELRPNMAISDEFVAVIDAGKRIVVPGFVDTHSHSYQGVLRSIMPSGVLDPDYNRDVQSLLTPAFSPADVYAGVLVTALGLIDMGTTAIIDLSQISHTPEDSDACVRALQDSGIRAVFAYSRGAGPATQYPQDLLRLQRTYFNSKDQLLTLALGLGLDPKLFVAAREAGVPAVLHMRNDSAKLLELGRAALLRLGDAYIHCTNLNDAAWHLIRDSGGRVSLCPQIEMAMGHGMPAVQQALDMGMRPSLSSDHGVSIAQDFFTIMRTVFTFQRMQIFARRRAGEASVPPLITCRDVLEFATLAGARCANLDGKVGSLTPSKEADILLLRADTPSLWPVNNAPGTVVNMMSPANVETVFIAGKVKKWRGSLVGVDWPRVMSMADAARDAVMRRTGFSVKFLG